MEITCVDTSLNLNIIPPNQIDVAASIVEEGLMEELKRLSKENKKLTERLKQVCENYLALQKHLTQFTNFEDEFIAPTPTASSSPSLKRKQAESDHSNKFGYTECSTTTTDDQEDPPLIFKRPTHIHNNHPKVSKIFVRTDASDTSLYVRDGYQWRKYGQKVTRDNPSPRAYFRCSFAPNCPVKKKVQRSAEDPSLLVATYEGEHNHAHHNPAEISVLSSRGQSESPTSAVVPMLMSTSPTVTLDLVQAHSSSSGLGLQKSSSIHQFLVQHMATSLTKDPNFTAALATAISGTILDHNSIKTR